MAKKKKTASTGGGVLGALATTAFSDEGAADSSLFSASEASLPPAPPAAPKAKERDDYDAALDRVLAAKPAKKRSKAPPPPAPEEEKPAKKRRKEPVEAEPSVEDDAAARTIFVGNLPREATKKQLARFFRPYGTVQSSRKRSVAVAGCAVDTNGDDKLVQSVCARKGLLSDAKRTTNAYVVFEDVEGATNALKANGAVWKIPASIEDGVETPEETFHLRVDKASGDRGAQDHLRTAFVGNCPFDSSEEGLRELFAAHLQESGGHSAVENVRVVRDKEHRCVGVAYVLLRDREVLSTALDLDGASYGESMDPRPLRVQPCGKRTKSSVLPRGATKKVTKKAAFGARRRLEKKARRAEARAKGAAPAAKAAPWQGKRAADAGKGPAKKKKKKSKEGKKTFVGKRKT
jgi:nucleolar protein 12